HDISPDRPVALFPVQAEPCTPTTPRHLNSPIPEPTSTHINLYIDNHKYRGPPPYITHSYPSPPRDAPLLPHLPSLPPARPIPPASTSPPRLRPRRLPPPAQRRSGQ